jgi:hypothetical protein
MLWWKGRREMRTRRERGCCCGFGEGECTVCPVASTFGRGAKGGQRGKKKTAKFPRLCCRTRSSRFSPVQLSPTLPFDLLPFAPWCPSFSFLPLSPSRTASSTAANQPAVDSSSPSTASLSRNPLENDLLPHRFSPGSPLVALRLGGPPLPPRNRLRLRRPPPLRLPCRPEEVQGTLPRRFHSSLARQAGQGGQSLRQGPRATREVRCVVVFFLFLFSPLPSRGELLTLPSALSQASSFVSVPRRFQRTFSFPPSRKTGKRADLSFLLQDPAALPVVYAHGNSSLKTDFCASSCSLSLPSASTALTLTFPFPPP